MRASKNTRRNQGRRILVGVGILSLGFLGVFTVQQLWGGSPRLLSVQEVSDFGNSCYRPSDDGIRNDSSSQNLFTAFETRTVYAQDANTVIQNAQKAMGDVQAVTAQIGDIKRLFSNVKTRGGWGETQVKAMLDDILPPGAYETNKKVRPDSDDLNRCEVSPDVGHGLTACGTSWAGSRRPRSYAA